MHVTIIKLHDFPLKFNFSASQIPFKFVNSLKFFNHLFHVLTNYQALPIHLLCHTSSSDQIALKWSFCVARPNTWDVTEQGHGEHFIRTAVMILPLCFIPAVTITEAGAIQRALAVQLPGQARDLPSLRTQHRSCAFRQGHLDLGKVCGHHQQNGHHPL